MSGKFSGSIGRYGRFFGKHHRDAVSYRIKALARFALVAGIVGNGMHGILANRADEYSENFFGNRHDGLQMLKENCSRGRADWPMARIRKSRRIPG
jgi:hypothetical protein